MAELDIKALASRLARTYEMEMKEALSLASQMIIAEKLGEISDKINSIEYKFTTDM